MSIMVGSGPYLLWLVQYPDQWHASDLAVACCCAIERMMSHILVQNFLPTMTNSTLIGLHKL